MPEASPGDIRTVRIETDDDVDALRAAFRRLLGEGVAPDRVEWRVGETVGGDLFAARADDGNAASSATAAHEPPPVVRLPAFFGPMFDLAALHADPGRHALLYRLAWRLLHEPGLRQDPLDADRIQVERMSRAVGREIHKMHAFVRFRPLQAPGSDSGGPGEGNEAGSDPGSTVAESETCDSGGLARTSETLDAAPTAETAETAEMAEAAETAEPAEMAEAAATDQTADETTDETVRTGVRTGLTGGATATGVAIATTATGAAMATATAGAAMATAAPGDAADPARWHVAWFEPEHHVVRAAAPFFARRYGRMRWAILTPRCSVRWDGARLAVGPGARREDAPTADADERLWLTYYEHIFNPARLNLPALQRHMPRRYWNDLPEAELIHPLAARAEERAGRMVEAGGTEPTRRRPAASAALRVDQRRPAVAAIATLADLREATERCRACPIGEHATQAVNGEGPTMQPRLMLVGEQPGDQEDLRGRPFVGPAGKVLDRALAQLGWPRSEVYLTNAVRHFKFELRGKRRIHKTPSQQEAAVCLDWLEREIALVQPQAIVALGATAARSLMGRQVPVMAERGHWLARPDGRRVLVTLHPSALLRLPGEEFDAAFEAWLRDLKQADVTA